MQQRRPNGKYNVWKGDHCQGQSGAGETLDARQSFDAKGFQHGLQDALGTKGFGVGHRGQIRGNDHGR